MLSSHRSQLAEHLPTLVHSGTSRFNGRNGKDQLERYQFPVVVAWAVTIHKIQVLSLSRAVIDLNPDIFAHGQAYQEHGWWHAGWFD